jgi:FkbM family methyltransferase
MSYFLKKLRLARFLTGRIPTLGVAQWSQGMRDRNMAYAAMELAETLPPGLSTIVDVGAHAGLVSEALDFIYRPRRIWVVEPNPSRAEGLARKFGRLERFKVVHSCLGQENGEVSFFVHDFDAASSLYECKPGHLASFGFEEGRREIKVTMTTLRDLLSSEPGTIDLLKLDCQGAELSVIKGAGERLIDMRWIYSEVSIDPIYRGAPLWGELHEFLVRSGFELRKVDGFAGVGESVQWADALYANVRMR